jgi:hypothetical protein
MKKTKSWNSKTADKYFSMEVRKGGVCQRPNCPYCGNGKRPDTVLQNSHFWGRNHSSTRYELDNADCFCAGTHFKWEGEKAGCYREYMLKKLGQKRYDELEKLHNKLISRKDAIKKFQDYYQKIS